MGAFKQVASAYTNFELVSTQLEFSRRRKVLVITAEYCQLELGMYPFPEFTVNDIERLITELHTRQVLKSTDIVKAVAQDYSRDVVKVYVINPALPQVEVGVNAPEEIVPL